MVEERGAFMTSDLPDCTLHFIERIEYRDAWACPIGGNYLNDIAYLNWMRERDYQHCIHHYYAVGAGI